MSILKQPRLLAHLCGYHVNGLGFYHIPHALFSFGKISNMTALVMVQGGALSIPQLVAELGRLIPERWQWEVTQHENNSFIVPFPSRGDLLRAMAFEKAHIKEHNVDLFFEEWWPEEGCLGCGFGFIGCHQNFVNFLCYGHWARCWVQLNL
jgi:hypothetical protein